MAPTQSTTRLTKVATVLVPVTDQERALAFYTGTLGLEKRADVPYGNGDRWIEVAPPGADTTIALCVPPAGAGPAPKNVCYCSIVTTDIDAEHADLTARGVDCDDVMRMGDPVPPMFFFRDQDGNSLLIVQPVA